MATIINSLGNEIDFEAATNIMDRDICEELHAKMAPCEDQEFWDAYCRAHEAKYGEEFAPDCGKAW